MAPRFFKLQFALGLGLGLGLVAFQAFAQSPQSSSSSFHRALVRDAKFKAQVKRVELDDTLSEEAFDGQHFKIVEKRSDDPILFSVQPELALKAATVYYHLTKARRYFLNLMNDQESTAIEKLTIRIEHSALFSELGHFMHENRDPQFNNALSIPAGKAIEGSSIEPWSREIWFRPSKKIPYKEILAAAKSDPLHPLLSQVRKTLYPGQLNLAFSTSLAYVFAPQSMTDPYWLSMTRQAGTLALIEAGLQTTRGVNRLLLPHDYFLETAMVPEIIYHEYSHIALSDYIEISHSTPVIEGLADYFAAAISGSPILAARIKRYSTSTPKNGKKKQIFSLENESALLANADFTLSLLWGLRELFTPMVADHLVFESRTLLRTRSSDIRMGLAQALLQSCRTLCPVPATDRMRLMQYLQERGL